MNRFLFAAAALAAASFLACETTEVGSYPCPDAMDCSGKPPVRTGTGNGTVGGACQTGADCQSGTCVTNDLLASLGVDVSRIDITNGLCSAPCMLDADCGDGGSCASAAAFGAASLHVCLRACANLAQCRWKEGYTCWTPDPVAEPQQVCLPLSVIASYYCPSGCP